MSIAIDRKRTVQHREHHLWTQEELAAAAGVSARTVQRVEATGQASVETLHALAAAFNVPAESLIESPIDRTWVLGPILGMIGASIGCAFAFIGNYHDAVRDQQSFWGDPVTWFIAAMWAFAILFPLYMIKRHWNTPTDTLGTSIIN
jgi:transcriptional regulator with XRE-family HTH domain